MSPEIYVFLTVAIIAEVVATSALKLSDGFTRPWPLLFTFVGYAISFWFLSLTIRVMPMGIVYAIWSGVGIVFITAVGWLWFGQRLDMPAMVGLSLIVAGVFVVNVFSRTIAH
ncbi:DMT family transporter [Marinivivus vitaminiproducens]|uniref:DMT family transporter n=1 Tax=Marinivivus vitaminiproducens TaxID=3035935 RepID=UPI0027A47697|nr:SMR family transporter [Geminicoccaceae bacterium SCSIO 64248]